MLVSKTLQSYDDEDEVGCNCIHEKRTSLSSAHITAVEDGTLTDCVYVEKVFAPLPGASKSISPNEISVRRNDVSAFVRSATTPVDTSLMEIDKVAVFAVTVITSVPSV